MDSDTFLGRVREKLIELIKQELTVTNSLRINTIMWVRFIKDDEIIDLAFNSRMMSVFRGSDLDQIVDEMKAHIMLQIENPTLRNSRFIFDRILYLDASFRQLNLARGRSYLQIPCWISLTSYNQSQNDDNKCFQWAVIAADKWIDIGSHPERITKLRGFVHNYDWSGLELPVSIKDIGKFETNNNISVNVLAVRFEMPCKGSTAEFHNGQNQLRFPFIMYADFESILEPMHQRVLDPSESYTNEVNKHTPFGWCVYSKFAHGPIVDPLKIYRGSD